MKKICILSAVNIRHMTLISLYTERLKRDGIDYDIIYMDKYGEEEEFDATNKYVFTNIINQATPKLIKVWQYFKFKKYATAIMEKNQYDFIIVWNDVAIFMFGLYLAKRWKGKYCLNIRDYSGQKNPYVYWRFKRAIQNSAFSTISSDGFRSFLPPFPYLQVQSFNRKILDEVTPRTAFQHSGQPIRITFIGYVRFLEINTKLCNLFNNDNRFSLHYYGTHANKLERYTMDIGMSNCQFHDTFPVNETSRYIEKTDLINNLYGKDDISLQTALSIKLYYGIHHRTPILVFKNTHMADIISKYDIGFIVDEIDNALPDKIFNWYSQLDFDMFKKNCERALLDIELNHLEFEKVYAQYLTK